MSLPTIKYFGRRTPANNGRPEEPNSGFRLRIDLSRPVNAQDNNGQPLKVLIEYQRLERAPMAFFMRVQPVLDPGTTYFTSDPPKILEFPIGHSSMTTPEFKVR